MKFKMLLTLILILLLALAACQQDSVPEPEAEPTGEDAVQPETEAEEISVTNCAEPTVGTHQLMYAAQGVCFLYPEEYDVFQSDNGAIMLYVKSLLNTEAPSFSLNFEAANGRSLEDVMAQFLAAYTLPAGTEPESITLGGEPALMLDNLPGQDLNRHLVVIHNDAVYDMIVSRIGADYGVVGEQAEALYDLITDSLQFIEVEPEAPLLAGPECPEASSGTTLFTNTEDGYCLLLPDGYLVDDGLTTDSGGTETAIYVDSLQDVAHARLFITVEDAGGRSLEEITADKAAEVEAIMGTSPVWSFGYMLDGVLANQFDQVPGQDLSRQVVLVHKDRLITLTFIPDDPEAGDAYSDMQTLYDTVMDSFSFLWQS